jgi:TRAP-type C4-dicarboxylate transport system substrate-binding protein
LRARRLLLAFAVAAGLGCRTPASTFWLSGCLTPAGSPTSEAARHFVSLVQERTDGRVRIDHYDTSQLGSGQQQIEALALGTQHVYFGSGSAVSILVPEYGVVDVAFLFRNRAHFDAFLRSDMVRELNERLLRRFKIRVLAMNWFRKPRYLLHRERFIRSPADIQGARARTPNLPMFIANWENLGAVPVKVAFFEQYLALSQNLVEMTEASGDDIYPMKLHEVAPYITEADMMYPQASAYVAESAFRSLSADDQRIVLDAAREAGELHTELVNRRFAEELARMREQGGQLAPLPPEGRTQFRALVESRVDAMEAAGLIPEGWFERIQNLRSLD